VSPLCVYFTSVHSAPSITVPYPFTFHPHFSMAFSTHPYIFYLHRWHVLWYYWCSIILFSFPFFPEFHRVVPYYKCVLQMSLYMIMLVFVYIFTFWICLPHMRESMWPLSFWACLTTLNMMFSNCIHLPRHCSLWLSKTPWCIYTTISWFIHHLLGVWFVSIAWLLWTMLWWTSVYSCLYCILTYVPLSR
jgi:hypothetical protein